MPEFWLDECKDGSIILHYQSKRGNYLAPIVKGTVTEAAKVLFEIEIVMDRVTTQGVDGSRFTRYESFGCFYAISYFNLAGISLYES